MKNRKMPIFLLGSMMLGGIVLTSNSAFASTDTVLTTQQAITKYNTYYNDYVNNELVKVQQYENLNQNIKGSLADQIVERAIWYMNNGYMVYGHGTNSYQQKGIVDCSAFTRLVFGDFGFNITGAARNYNTVGTQINGVKPVQTNGKWSLQGTENLRPGDILTWWAKDSNGNKYISHVAIYMGMMNGQPAVIGTRGDGNPTAIGIVNDFRYWWGSKFLYG